MSFADHYLPEYQRSMSSPEAFWREQAARLPWFVAPQTVLDEQQQWFADGELNTCYMALDYHVEQGRGEQVALYYDSPVTDTREQWSYQRLRDEVAKFAGALQAQGVGRGDRVVIYLPMIPQAAIAMLACARLGAVHSVVFGGFAPHELALRIDDAEPKAVITASCGVEIDKVIAYKPMVDKAIAEAKHKPQAVIVYQRPQCQADLKAECDHDWQQLMATANAVGCTAVNSNDPLYVLYTSGTTGKPKGVVRDNGGHAVALNYSMQYVYGMQPGQTFWAASDVGWVVGHSYIVYAPLIFGCSSVLYEGKPIKTPDAGAFWRVCADYQVKAVFAAPTAFRAIKKEDPQGELIKQYDLSQLERIYMAGERLDPATYEWTCEHTAKPVYDHWWQTETGWPVCANPVGEAAQRVKPGSPTFPVPGYQITILSDSGEPLKPGEQGAIAIKLPLPPGCLLGIWRNPERYHDGYLAAFPGYYSSGDGGYFDEQGYLYVMGRTDDVINVAGHRLSTGEMEEVIATHRAVAECAVVGSYDEIKGEVPVAFVIIKNQMGVEQATLQQQLIEMIRADIGAIACLKHVYVVNRLPKTRSGKILRRVMRQILNGESYNVPSTIDDPSSLDDIAAAVVERKQSA
ncbi:propionyl-CoA synthetase [Idiomarina xiamenensis]|uniref:Propionyl-CoA synthetase n=1 Tax=Idiomarina xiamenensis 10-D-4 TaxID=740709 RepID=K2L226_9GAMM|nr:propionyl-CoA synthetase [Idiomarina xiamenensis]EKE83900.1 propionyl-CoA synthetase [Idiomarina xiamenensis 10-D-4]